jgi:hypothetical protein
MNILNLLVSFGSVFEAAGASHRCCVKRGLAFQRLVVFSSLFDIGVR